MILSQNNGTMRIVILSVIPPRSSLNPIQYADVPSFKVGDQARIIRFLKKNRNFVFLLDLFFSYLRFAISK